MKIEKVVWGIVLIFVGGVLLLENLNLINFNWHVVFQFWPVILIVVGANLLFSRNNTSWGASLPLIITLLALGFFAYKGITTASSDEWSMGEHQEGSGHHSSDQDIFKEAYHPDVKKAVLNIRGGAIEYKLRDTTVELFQAEVRKNFGNFSLRRTSNDSINTLDFDLKGKSKMNMDGNDSNSAILKLHTQPLWDIHLEMGAGTADFDLSRFKIQNFSIEGGAASFTIKLGEPLKTTNLSIQTGVSEVEVNVPRSVPCLISVESGLSSNDFEGFTKQQDGTYATENFRESPKSIRINLEGGMSKFEVNRY